MELISRDKAQEIIPKVVLGASDFAECIRDSVDTVFDNCPSAFDGMTYGEVITNIVPNLQVVNATDGAIEVANSEFNIMVSRKVWDSPYKG